MQVNEDASVVIVGGTSGLGKEVARYYAERGREVVVSGRDLDRAGAAAREIGGRTRGVGFDLAEPEQIAPRLADVDRVGGLVLAAIDRDDNSVADYDIASAARLVTLKLVGYTEVVHTLAPRMGGDGAVVLFGGMAMARPYPGSTTVSTVNGGVTGMVATLAVELAPIRVNAVHPGIVGDSPNWAAKPEAVERVEARTPGKRPVRMRDVVGAVAFLLDNESVNGVNLRVDSGWLLQ